MSFMDEMMNEIKNPGSEGIFNLGKGEDTTIRFITEANQGFKFFLHRRFLDKVEKSGYKLPCALAFGHENCPLCKMKENKQNGRYSRKQFTFVVFNYTTNSIEVMYFGANSKTPLEQIGKYYEKNRGKTLLGRDFFLSHNDKDGWEEAYQFSSDDQSEWDPAVAAIVAKQFGKAPNPKDLIETPLLHNFMKEAIAKQLYAEILDKPLVYPQMALLEPVNGKMPEIVEKEYDPFAEEADEDEDLLPTRNGRQ